MDDMYISYVFFFKGYPVHPTVSWVDRSCFQSGLPGTPTANESAHLVLPTEESALPIHPTRLRECAGYLAPQDQGLYCNAVPYKESS